MFTIKTIYTFIASFLALILFVGFIIVCALLGARPLPPPCTVTEPCPTCPPPCSTQPPCPACPACPTPPPCPTTTKPPPPDPPYDDYIERVFVYMDSDLLHKWNYLNGYRHDHPSGELFWRSKTRPGHTLDVVNNRIVLQESVPLLISLHLTILIHHSTATVAQVGHSGRSRRVHQFTCDNCGIMKVTWVYTGKFFANETLKYTCFGGDILQSVLFAYNLN